MANSTSSSTGGVEGGGGSYVSLREIVEIEALRSNKKSRSRSRTTSHDDEARHGFIMWHSPTLILMVLLGIFFNMEYSILMPTVWEYLQSMNGSKLYLGYVVGAFSLARMIVFGPVGWWTDKRRMKEVFLVTCFISILGNALYGMAGKIGKPWVLVLARLLTGAGATSAVTSRSYLARVTTARARTMALAVQNAIQFIGVLIGPALNFLFTKLDFNLGPYIEINERTAAGYAMIIPNAICLIGFLFCFEEPPSITTASVITDSPSSAAAAADADAHHHSASVSSAAKLEHHHQRKQSHDNHDATVDSGKAERRRVLIQNGGWWCLYTGFMTTFTLSALETAITPITTTHFHWSTMENSYLFSGLAIAALAAVIFTLILGKRGRYDREIAAYGCSCLIISLLIQIIGSGDGVHVSLWSIVIGGILLAFGLLATASPTTSLFTKMIGDRNQGLFNSLQYFCIATGRFLGPLATGICLSGNISESYFPFYGFLLALTLLTVLGLIKQWKLFGQVEKNARKKTRYHHRKTSTAAAETLGTANSVFGGGEGDDTLSMPLLTKDEEEANDDGDEEDDEADMLQST